METLFAKNSNIRIDVVSFRAIVGAKMDNTLTLKPSAIDVVRRTLKNLKRIGSPRQQLEASAIEQVLAAHFEQPEVVSFAREESPPPERAQPGK